MTRRRDDEEFTSRILGCAIEAQQSGDAGGIDACDVAEIEENARGVERVRNFVDERLLLPENDFVARTAKVKNVCWGERGGKRG